MIYFAYIRNRNIKVHAYTENPTILHELIEVEFNKPYGGETHMTIVGKTDLPDGEEVLISVVSEENDYIASSKDIVKDGIYISEPFSKQGESIPKGEYTITVETSNNSKAKQEKIVDIDY